MERRGRKKRSEEEQKRIENQNRSDYVTEYIHPYILLTECAKLEKKTQELNELAKKILDVSNPLITPSKLVKMIHKIITTQ